MLELLAIPFLACVVLTAIHVYLGLHVLARGVIFVDLALAQVAALGLSVAILAGHPLQSDAAYWYALVFTVGGAALFAASRVHRGPVPQEAIIGIVYAVSAALAVLVVDRAPQGSEHIKQLLTGSILTVTAGDVATITILYAVVGFGHWLIRRPLLDISIDPDGARRRRAVRAWDLVFYTSFGIVVTSSVRLAGVLLVFSYLIVPAVVAAIVTGGIAGRLVVGWAVGVTVSALGLMASWTWDLPTGATIVSSFGVLLSAVVLVITVRAGIHQVKARGRRALADFGLVGLGVIGLAGLILFAIPGLDQPWLDALEAAVPAVQLAFLDADERQAWVDTRVALDESNAELARVRRLQHDVQWGRREISPEMQERLGQYIAGRTEMVTGDRLVLRSLRERARRRQRYLLGLPLAVGNGAVLVVVLRRRRAASAESMTRPPASEELP